MEISRWRRLLGQGLIAAPGLWLGYEGAFRDRSASEVVCGGLVVAGAVLLGRRGVVAQVLGRGAAWAVAGPCLLATALTLAVERRVPELAVVALTTAASAALVLTRPMLETPEAKAAFAPLAARRWLLLASTAAVAASIALSTLFVELVGRQWHAMPSVVQWLGLPLLAGSLVASAVGVARMRAWGILLGAATSLLALVVGAAMHDRFAGLMLATTALPGAGMAGAILAARARASASGSGSTAAIRIASEPAALRVSAPQDALEADGDLELHELEAPRAVEPMRIRVY